jgi:hypothetical protein
MRSFVLAVTTRDVVFLSTGERPRELARFGRDEVRVVPACAGATARDVLLVRGQRLPFTRAAAAAPDPELERCLQLLARGATFAAAV